MTAKTRMDRIEWSPGLRGCGYTAEMKRWVRGQLHPLGRRITELERKLEGK